MRMIPIDDIKGNEILARDVYSELDMVLISKGSQVKKEYIERLKSLKIDYLYIHDEFTQGIEENGLIEVQIREESKNRIKFIMDQYSYCGDVEFEMLKNTAEEIIMDLLGQPEIMFNISGIRKKSEKSYLHALNVCTLSTYLALQMKLSKKKVKEIALGSILHDIGMLYIPLQYQENPYEDLSEKEQKEIKKHVVYGYSAVEKETWLTSSAKDIILSHHERLDGSGYPFHLNGDRIKIGTRIVAVCDEFDQLVFGNIKKKKKVHEAIEYIVGMGGFKFDLRVVNMFNQCVAAYPNGTTVLTTEGETGIVLRQNFKLPTRPVIRIIKDKEGNVQKEWVVKDLTRELALFIMKEI